MKNLRIEGYTKMAAGQFIVMEPFLDRLKRRLIGQKELVKTAICIEISIHMAVISFLKEDIGWTKRVGKDADMC